MTIIKPRLFCFFISFFLLAALDSRPAAIAQTDNPHADTDTGKRRISLNELAFGTGYIQGSLDHGARDLAVYPAFVRIGLTLNPLLGIRSERASLQLALEPFLNPVSSETDGVEAGIGIGLRYRHKLSLPLDIYIEGSIAPMYLGIDTGEQGAGGFNFLNQAGAGLQYRITKTNALFGGYRFRHISHAGTMDRSNDGINSHALVLGVSWIY
ncbi:MAG: acyloxyacyl hydrolase [Chlorobium phaeobacteroides]|jgi:hypothetical protein|nr:acyloxyacyl hydrolase [Chlorobium phaeobacteroides]